METEEKKITVSYDDGPMEMQDTIMSLLKDLGVEYTVDYDDNGFTHIFYKKEK